MKVIVHIILTILLFTLSKSVLMAQVDISNTIQLTNEEDSLRIIKNIGLPIDSNDAISLNALREQNIVFNSAEEVNMISLELTPEISEYKIGMQITFETVNYNTGPVYIALNNLSPIEIVKHGAQALDSADFFPGKIAQIVYDGENFQILNDGDKICPSGFLSVNENFCIEEFTKGIEVSYFEAVKSCMDEGYRLCSWSEWSSACDKLNHIENDFTSQWEWVNTSSDHHNGAKIVGDFSCDNNWYSNAELTVYKYRCCMTK